MSIKNIDLEAMRNVDIRTVDRSKLKDIKDVVIDTTLPQEERLLDFINQIGNPYCCNCGDLVIKLTFATNTDATLEDKLEHYLATM
ncbi:MAG: DUF6870 family protein [Rikenellaceae bacterium]